MTRISICIPTYEMHGLGVGFLNESFEKMCAQTFKDFDVIVSDHSIDDSIENACKKYHDRLAIHYFKNPDKRGNSSANVNNAIRHATGAIIKILFQDDFLYHEYSLEKINENFDLEKDDWLVTACIHTRDGKDFFRPFYPSYNSLVYLGKNTVGSPSILAIKNDRPLFFDERLIWLMDCDYYKRLHDAFGKPVIVSDITIANRIGTHQISNTLANMSVRIKETFLMIITHARH